MPAPDTDALLGLDEATADACRHLMRTLQAADVPFLVGGAYAFTAFTTIRRRTADFDVFVRRDDLPDALAAVERAGFETHVPYPHWLAKATRPRAGGDGAAFDLIFRSGNGVTEVDDSWLARAPQHRVLGIDARLCPPEELLVTKAFIMERERYDGSDVAHLLRGCAGRLDWERLQVLFGPHWRVLLSHLILFGFIYPGERGRIPDTLMDDLLRRLNDERRAPARDDRLCRGTLLSRAQYLVDVEVWGYRDARVRDPDNAMTERDVAQWTDAIGDDVRKPI